MKTLNARHAPTSRRRRLLTAGATAVALTIVALGGQAGSGSAAPPTAFAAGSLIIPMDTDTSGNHASYNQNLGMWKAYGLVYKLLQNDIPVQWAIDQTKTTMSGTDFTATTKDKRTNTALGSYSYSGGPFVIDSADAAEAMPIITAWWAANGNLPNVHEATAGFNAEVRVHLNAAPRIANEAINGGITIAYYNAAGIPDDNGNPWSLTSPNILTETTIAGGGLFESGAACLQRKYDLFVTPHNGGYAYSLTNPTDLGTRTYAQLDTFVEQGGGWTALCHSILSNENNIADLTLNGSPAVKALFKASQLGGKPGGFLTKTGFPAIDNTSGTWTLDPTRAGLPVAQFVPTTGATQALPGGSVQTWPHSGTLAPQYWAQTERVASFSASGVDHDQIIAGTYHDATGAGKVTYIGGHSFSTALPYSTNFEGPYLRAFFNSIFFNGNAVAKMDLSLHPDTYPQNGSGPMTVSLVNSGGTTAKNVTSVSVTLQPGFTYLATTSGPAPVQTGQTLNWIGGLGDVPGGASVVTFTVAVDPSVSSTLGSKNFGQFTAMYGDDYGEGFKVNVCRDITIEPVPAPSLTKTPASQGPVTTGSNVTWTLNYGNPGGTQLQNGVLRDTLPAGFTYVSSSSTPSLGAPTVIPGSQTQVRWNVGNVNGNTPSAGTVTITARAGAITSGTGTPPQQTFTNTATFSGKDSSNNTYSVNASADVIVQALDVTLGKSVDNTFISSLPGSVTYTLTPRSSTNDPLSNVRVIDPFPTGLTAPPTALGQGSTYGAYSPIAAVPGHEAGPPVLDTTMGVSGNVFTQGGSVTVTLNVKSSTAIPGVSPNDLSVAGGDATCTGPSPASGNVPAGGAGLNFTWSCTLNDLGEYVFSDGADDGGSNSWPDATSASVLSTATGGPNVVAWSLGSTTAAVPGSTIVSGYTAGIYGFRGATQTTFQKYDQTSNSWSAKTGAPATVKNGGALTTDGAGKIYALRGNGTQTFYSYDIATDAWTTKANTGTNVDKGGALVFLDVGGTNYVFATMGNSTTFKRYDIGADSWLARAVTPDKIADGGALTTDGTYIYALGGNAGPGKKNRFYRYDPVANTWATMTNTPADVAWGGALVRLGSFIYAFEGNGKKLFWRYSIAGNSWTAMTQALGNVGAGAALTTDGTNIFAFQGKSTAFWRYNVALNTWSTLATYTAATDQGGALVYAPGVSPQGRFTSLSASRSLVVTGDTVTITHSLTSSTSLGSITSGTLTTTPTGGASCGTLTGPTLTSADSTSTGTGDPVTYQWTCTVAAGANPGSLTFSISGATGSGPVAFPAATSNSVLVSPPLTFTATVPNGAPNPVVDQALMIASGQAASSPPVSTFVGTPILEVTKSNSPDQNTTLQPGDPITYTMVVENVGSGNATGVTVTDPVPTNTSYVSCSGGASCSQAAGTVTWNVGSLAPGATATVSFTVSTSTSLPISSSSYTISNTAHAYSTQVPTPVNSNTVTNPLEVLPTIVKSVDKMEAANGDTLTYTLTVSNPGAAFTANVTDALPAGTSFGGLGTCSPVCTFGSGTVAWNGATIAHGTNTFTFAATVTASGGSTVTNSASLDPTSPDISPIASNPVATEIGPVLAMIKLNNPIGQVASGNTVTYTLVVNNESNVNATGVVVTDPVPAHTTYVASSCTTPSGTCSLSSGNVVWNLGTIAANDTATLTFQVTVGTVPPGTFQIPNQATATASNSNDQASSNVVYNTLPIPTLSLTKTPSPTTYDHVGQAISYTYVVTNNDLTTALAGPITIADDKTTASCPAGDLNAGASKTCTASYTITQADLDAGSVTNTAQATSANNSHSNSAQATVTADQSPSLSLTKDGTLDMTVVAPSGRVDVGDKVNYTLTATNTGNVTLHSVAISDPKLGSLTCTQPVTLAPGAQLVCTGSYTVTQGEIDAGEVDNVASVDSTETPPTDTPKTVPLTKVPALAIDKSALPTTYDHVGQVISYTFLVTNTGNTTLPGPFVVSDDKASDESCPATASLAPGASITCTASYTITQADLDAGSVTNVAAATNGVVISPTDTATVTAVQSPGLSLTKDGTLDMTVVAPSGRVDLGDKVNYTLTATNTGNVTLHGVTISDAKLGTLTCTQPVTLAPGAQLVCTGSSTVTQGEIDAGQVDNTATADSTETPPTNTPKTVPLTKVPALAIDKSALPTTYDHVGQVISYSFLVTNTGNTTLAGPFTVTDDKASDESCPATLSLAPGASITCTASYAITQADLDSGSVTNIASATNGSVTSPTDTATVSAVQSSGLAIDKSALPTTYDHVGQIVSYSFVVTNTGNTTLFGGFSVADDKATDEACPPTATLAPGSHITCTASDTITQADLDAGSVTNIAYATNGVVTSATDTETVTAVQAPALSIDKSASPTTYDSVGDVIGYTFVVANAGNVTLSGPFTVSDDKATDESCPVTASLAPSASITCTASYAITQADLDAGSVTNVASASNGTVTSPTDSATVTAVQTPALTIDKSALPTTYDHVGQVIAYSFVVSNAGNVTLAGPFTVSDDKASDESCPLAVTLAPGASITCTATYTITQADLDSGSVTNVASASNGTVTSPTDTATVNAVQSPALSLTKDGTLDMTVVAPSGRVDVGDRVDYTLTATNTGNVTLHGVTISDAKLGTLTCTQPVTLAPGAQLVCTGSYTVTQGEIDAGQVDNTATADSTETPPTNTPKTVPLTKAPALSLSKDGTLDMTIVAPSGRVDVGDRIDYTLTATNTGNTTLTGVTISDTKLGTLTCTQPVTLAPGAQLVCTGSSTVTQGEIDAGQVDNTATADSTETPPVDTPKTIPLTQVKTLSLDKTATESTYFFAGDDLHYQYVVTNTGNTSLAGPVMVADDKASVTCPDVSTVGDNDSALDPGESITCTATYTVLAADITAGSVTNHATASVAGVDSNQDSVIIPKTTVNADLAVTKASTPNPYTAGSSLTYTIVVTNNGPSGISNASVTDTVPAAITGVTWTCSITTGTGNCDDPSGGGNTISTTVDLANGAAATYVVTGTVDSATTGTITNTVTVTTPVGVLDPSPGNNVASDSNPTTPVQADPAIAISPTSTSVGVGATVPFTITVSNNGPSAATGVKAIVSVPPGYGFVSAAGSGWTCALNVNLVVCDFAGSFAASASSQISLTLTAPGTTGQSTVNASVTSVTTDTNAGNNDASATVDVVAPVAPQPPATPKADLSLVKTASTARVATGEQITYKLTVTNNGPDTAQNVILIDTLPTTITFVSVSGNGWACSAVANIVTCTRASLASGASASVDVVGTANRGGSSIVNAGSVGSDTPDPTSTNNTATATIDVTAKADLAVDKSVSSATFVPGSKLAFTITVTNKGPDDVSGARVRDVVPAQLDKVSWTCSAVAGKCGSFSGTGDIDQLVDVTVGGRVVFAVVGTVHDPAPATMANTATVAPPTGTVDPVLANNRDSVEAERGVVPTRLGVDITPETATLTTGVPIPVKVVTTNAGWRSPSGVTRAATAKGVITCVSLPPGITVAQPNGGFALTGKYCWRTATLVKGARVTFKFKVRGDSRIAGRVRLVAQAQASNAPRVNDRSQLIVLSDKIVHTGGYTG